LYLYMAPKLIGNGPTIFMEESRKLMADAESLHILDVRQIGPDILIHASFNKGGDAIVHRNH
ncbi:MAG TPA: bifunctional diaminohydroxyphosphoribosylaminopyrimidine deaminase/5-amino-6-(5-phosphoribosylamino)uracil reductase, partial [Sporosarcina sp.]|nr:bifunctional diaminohydroxyphosphoribosylaminopyrimidine deaminase/5-amino-6-(5-phosphoribosylamino)uracil reductase [Sporosarcina sp.]